MNYYYLDGIDRKGPLSQKELKLLNLNPNTLIFQDGSTEWKPLKDIIESIKELDADVITIESAKSDLEMLDVLKCSCYDKEVGPGIYDIHSHRVPSVEEFKNNILSIINKLPDNNIWINPDCGLKTRGEYETILSLKNMVTATKEIREKFIKA